ncbi:hypothetical protein LX32DRAFT_78826 [Colletotrichum zoysiae]|uniref:Uncharacterized protein n=1 Tax=Colletotrichum zoysiae TaxID=1216348 RepID=A0AAD9LXX5_9PEZI|nr:hypothetical protein LX32DRAFT_78826 [Colletotrichum zoysiae]
MAGCMLVWAGLVWCGVCCIVHLRWLQIRHRNLGLKPDRRAHRSTYGYLDARTGWNWIPRQVHARFIPVLGRGHGRRLARGHCLPFPLRLMWCPPTTTGRGKSRRRSVMFRRLSKAKKISHLPCPPCRFRFSQRLGGFPSPTEPYLSIQGRTRDAAAPGIEFSVLCTPTYR